MASMAARSIGSGRITFGLVGIPVKVYTAVSPKSVGFNMLHATCGSRLKQQLVCITEDVVVEHKDTVKGFEYSKDQYVRFEADELKALEAARTGEIGIEEFVPTNSVALTYIEKSYYLGPDKGGDYSYALLAQALHRNDRLGVARYAARGKDQLVLIRAIDEGKVLVMHYCYYGTEVHSFEEVDIGGAITFKAGELALADTLIKQLSSPAFDPSKYRDSWAETVAAAVQRKVAGEEIAVTAPPPRAAVVDLLEALKLSVEAANRNGKAKVAKGPKKAEPRQEQGKKKRRENG